MKIGKLETWRAVPMGDVILLPGPARLVEIEFLGADAVVSVLDGETVYPLKRVNGYEFVRFEVRGNAEIVVETAEPLTGTALLYRTKDQDRINETDGRYTEPFVVMMERGPQTDPEFRRMMVIAELNERRRQQAMEAMRAELAAMRQEVVNGKVGTGAAAGGATAPTGVAGNGDAAAAAGASVTAGAGQSAGAADTGTAGAPKPAGSATSDAGSAAGK